MEAPAKLPSELFADLLQFGRFLSRAVGVDFADPKYRFNRSTFIVTLFVLFYFISSGITLVEMFEESWVQGLQAMCVSVGALQGVAKFISVLIYTRDISSMGLLLHGLYMEYENKGSKCRNACYECCRSVRRILITIGIGYGFLSLSAVGMPLALWAFTGSRHMFLQFQVPFVDPKTDFGYVATQGVHLVSIFVGSFGLFAGDVFVLIYLSQSFLFAGIMKIKVEEINENSTMWESETRNEDCKELLLDLIQWHQLYTQFTRSCNDMYYYLVSAQVISAAVAILLTLVVAVAGDWPSSYIFLGIMCYSLCVYCVLGTKIEECNDQFCWEIYNISWYNLSVPQQKMVRLMLMKAQTPNMLDVAGIMPLSVSTALQITKTIYSIFMILMQFLK